MDFVSISASFSGNVDCPTGHDSGFSSDSARSSASILDLESVVPVEESDFLLTIQNVLGGDSLLNLDSQGQGDFVRKDVFPVCFLKKIFPDNYSEFDYDLDSVILEPPFYNDPSLSATDSPVPTSSGDKCQRVNETKVGVELRSDQKKYKSASSDPVPADIILRRKRNLVAARKSRARKRAQKCAEERLLETLVDTNRSLVNKCAVLSIKTNGVYDASIVPNEFKPTKIDLSDESGEGSLKSSRAARRYREQSKLTDRCRQYHIKELQRINNNLDAILSANRFR